jgi:hypothetical protein
MGTPTSHGMGPKKIIQIMEDHFGIDQSMVTWGSPILRNQYFRPEQQVDPLPWVTMSTFLLVGIHGYPYYGF